MKNSFFLNLSFKLPLLQQLFLNQLPYPEHQLVSFAEVDDF